METVNAICVVAHPDDCVIFARPFIENYCYYQWTILYLTYCESDSRAQEVAEYWNAQGIKTLFLGFVDDYRDIENKKISFNEDLAKEQIINISKQFDLILTHHQDGEYGHIHHKFVHSCVAGINSLATFYFSPMETAELVFSARSTLNLDQFPLHRDVISEFNNIDTGYYIKAQ